MCRSSREWRGKRSSKTMKYWLCVTNEENWRIIEEKRIWGIPKRRKAIIERVRPGDVLVFSVRSRRIGGIFKAVSEPFECNGEIFGPVKGEKFPNRVGIEPVKIPEGPVSFKNSFQNSALRGIASSGLLCLGGGV